MVLFALLHEIGVFLHIIVDVVCHPQNEGRADGFAIWPELHVELANARIGVHPDSVVDLSVDFRRVHIIVHAVAVLGRAGCVLVRSDVIQLFLGPIIDLPDLELSSGEHSRNSLLVPDSIAY